MLVFKTATLTLVLLNMILLQFITLFQDLHEVAIKSNYDKA